MLTKRAACVSHVSRTGIAMPVTTGGYACDVLASAQDVSAVTQSRRKPHYNSTLGVVDPRNRFERTTGHICNIWRNGTKSATTLTVTSQLATTQTWSRYVKNCKNLIQPSSIIQVETSGKHTIRHGDSMRCTGREKQNELLVSHKNVFTQSSSSGRDNCVE